MMENSVSEQFCLIHVWFHPRWDRIRVSDKAASGCLDHVTCKGSSYFRISECMVNRKVLEWTRHLHVWVVHIHLTSDACPFASSLSSVGPLTLTAYTLLSPSTLGLHFFLCSCGALHSVYSFGRFWTDYLLPPYCHPASTSAQTWIWPVLWSSVTRDFPPSTEHICSWSQLSLYLPLSCFLIHSRAKYLFPKIIIMGSSII